jgi:hypothetical protein
MELNKYAHKITSHQPSTIGEDEFRPQFKNMIVLFYTDSNKNVIKL